MEFRIFEKLLEAFETSTQSDNRFSNAINSIKWEDKFFADDEFYFCIGKLIFTTPHLNPFDCGPKGSYLRPSATFTSDASTIEF